MKRVRRIALAVVAVACISGTALAQDDRSVLYQDPPTPYKENYFVIGPFHDDTRDRDFNQLKFQISFKKSIVKDYVFFGYTQISFWDIGRKSEPFRDSNYNPEIFGSILHECPKTSGRCEKEGSTLRSLLVGIEHESNGRDGTDSRGWNRLYLMPIFGAGSPGNLLQFKLMWKTWYVLSYDRENNPDIIDVYGSNEVTVSVQVEEFLLSVVRREGHKPKFNRTLVDVTYPWRWLGAFLQVQYSDGWGESLLEYNKKNRTIRAGLMFSR